MPNDSQDLVGAIQEKLGALNVALEGLTPYKLAVVDPRLVRLVDKNARSMKKRTFDQLADNIRSDGALASTPLLWKDGAAFECLSGNHRVQASITAGLSMIVCWVIDKPLTLSEKRAIQLSHNSLAGEDAPDMLRELYAEIEDLSAKVYSGLDDKFLDTLPKPSLLLFSDQSVRFERLEFLFTEKEIEKVEEIFKRLGKRSGSRHLASIETFDRFFDALLRFKDVENVKSSEAALLAICDIVDGYLILQEAKAEQPE